MINLTPIAKPIQERMFEKMSVLGKEKKYIGQPSKADELQLQDMATRTTFIRMTSGQENPVVMMGGELSDDKEMRVGFTDIYGPKTYSQKGFEGEFKGEAAQNLAIYKVDPNMKGKSKAERKEFWEAHSTTYINPNTFKRPIPGIKSIDVQFKGGVRALRTANISWTCWSFEDLDRLMTHFLSHGKTVALEWGWVHNKKRFQSLPSLIDSNGKILEEGFLDYRKTILSKEVKGDFDFMVGVVKNFEYTTRDDGGFDCKTDIVSTGVNILNANSVSEGATSKLTLYDIKEDDTLDEKIEKLSELEKDNAKLENIFYDGKLSFSIFMDRFSYWMNNYYGQFGDGTEDAITSGALSYRGRKKSFIIANPVITDPDVTFNLMGTTYNSSDYENPVEDEVWVRWGWFEDNILNKFFAMISPTAENDAATIINEFRSVNRLIENDIPIDRFESTRIRNSSFLETTNYKKFILPGQFTPINQEKLFEGADQVGTNTERNRIRAYISGDDAKTIELANTVNENFDNFAVDDERKEGYFRNILFNVNFLKECFSFADNTDVKTGLENIFTGMNADINFWKLDLEVDSVESKRLKVIDENTTHYDWSSGFDPIAQKSIPDNPTGVFHFPVWKHNSIVKRQSIAAKLPSSMQMAAMYGANIDQYKNILGSDQNLDSKGKAAGALGRGNNDIYKKGADLAYRFPGNVLLGKTLGNESGSLSLSEGPTLDMGFPGSSTAFEGIKKVITEDIQTQLAELEKTRVPDADPPKKENSESTSDFSGMLPSPESFTNPTKFVEFLVLLSDVTKGFLKVKFEGKTYKFKNADEADSMLRTYTRKYDVEGKMKDNYIDSISKFITVYGKSRSDNIPVLIPLTLELTIDGIGGIYPGNSFHSDYVPSRYRKEAMFQCFDVNHTVDGSGWSVSLNGKMRASLAGLYAQLYKDDEKVEELILSIFADVDASEVKPPEPYFANDDKYKKNLAALRAGKAREYTEAEQQALDEDIATRAAQEYTIEEQRKLYKSYGHNFTTVQINTISNQKEKLESLNLFLEYGGATYHEYFWQNKRIRR